MQRLFHDVGGISPAKKRNTMYLRKFGSLRNDDAFYSAITPFLA